jgi:multiple sugar transport system substrate-binding protein
MKMHKLSTAMLVLMVLSVLTGCAPAATPVPPPEPITVAVWVTDAPAVRKAAEAYEQETGGQVIVEEIAREPLREKEVTALMAKTGAYDVLWVPSEWIAELAEGGFLHPLDELMADANLPQPDQADWASPGAVESYKYKGKLYGFPVSMDTQFLYYRTDLIEKPPETWDEYLEVAKELTTDDMYGTALFGKLPESIAWDFMAYFWSFGGVLFDETFHPQVNSPEGVEALTYFVDLLLKHEVVPPGVPTYEYPEVLAAFQQGTIAMCIQWNAAYGDFASEEKSPLIYDKFAVTPLPGYTMPDGSVNRKVGGHVWGFVADANSKNIEGAYRFLVYLTGKEGLKYFPTDGASINVNSKAVLTDPAMVEAHPEFPLLNEVLKDMQLWPNATVTHDLILALSTEASAALAGTKTPQQAMDDANAAIDELMKSAGYY